MFDFLSVPNEFSARKLQIGETGEIIASNNNLSPKIKRGEKYLFSPVTIETFISVGDIVFCSPKGVYIIAKVDGVKGAKYHVADNSGPIGWVKKHEIYGLKK